MRRAAVLLGLSLLLASCATWSTSDVKPAVGNAAVAKAKEPAQVVVTENDITDRKYRTLGEISATVNKTTIFHPDPTKELVAEKLREEAAKLGADAVVLTRYGTVGVGLMSWGSLDGKGRAVAFE